MSEKRFNIDGFLFNALLSTSQNMTDALKEGFVNEEEFIEGMRNYFDLYEKLKEQENGI